VVPQPPVLFKSSAVDAMQGSAKLHVHVKMKVNRKLNTAYVREELREALGYEWSFNLDNGVGIVYPADMEIGEVIKRVKLNLEGLKIQAKSEEGKDGE